MSSVLSSSSKQMIIIFENNAHPNKTPADKTSFRPTCCTCFLVSALNSFFLAPKRPREPGGLLQRGHAILAALAREKELHGQAVLDMTGAASTHPRFSHMAASKYPDFVPSEDSYTINRGDSPRLLLPSKPNNLLLLQSLLSRTFLACHHSLDISCPLNFAVTRPPCVRAVPATFDTYRPRKRTMSTRTALLMSTSLLGPGTTCHPHATSNLYGTERVLPAFCLRPASHNSTKKLTAV